MYEVKVEKTSFEPDSNLRSTNWAISKEDIVWKNEFVSNEITEQLYFHFHFTYIWFKDRCF